MRDVLTEVLETVHFKSVLYFKQALGQSWGMAIAQGSNAQFHFVTSGECVFEVGGNSGVLRKGDILIIPHGTAHKLKGDVHANCRPGREMLDEIMQGTWPVPRGFSTVTELICGHYEIDKEVGHPIFNQLPMVIHISEQSYQRWSLFAAVLELIIAEMDGQRPGHDTISQRLAEVLFILIMRFHYQEHSSGGTNLFSDRKIYEAVALMHREIEKPWTVNGLAQRVGISRTLFMERFKKSVGDTPIKYLTNWRMIKARQLLKNTDLAMNDIADVIGYPSASSFQRAFKKWNQITPGNYRRKNAS